MQRVESAFQAPAAFDAITPTFEPVKKETISKLSESVKQRGRSLFRPQDEALLKKYEMDIPTEDLSLLDEMLQAVKKSSKEIGKTFGPDYDRITTNLLVYPEQSYLLTANPHTDSEQIQFWKTILEFDSPTVVTVLIPDEKGQNHELAYANPKNFPLNVGEGWQVTFSDKDLQILAQGIGESRIVKRLFTFRNLKTAEIRVIEHFHYEGWPNKTGAPDQKLFEMLIDLIDRSNPKRDRPITIHCAAGRGRSGTVVMAHVIKRNPAKAKNLAEILMHGRLQRDGFVEKKEQLLTVAQYAKSLVR